MANICDTFTLRIQAQILATLSIIADDKDKTLPPGGSYTINFNYSIGAPASTAFLLTFEEATAGAVTGSNAPSGVIDPDRPLLSKVATGKTILIGAQDLQTGFVRGVVPAGAQTGQVYTGNLCIVQP